MSAHDPLCIDAGSPCESALCGMSVRPRPFRRDLRRLARAAPCHCAACVDSASPVSAPLHVAASRSASAHPCAPMGNHCQCGAARVGALLRVNTAPPRIETPARWHRVRCADASTVSTWRRLWPHATTATPVRSMGAHQPHDKTGIIVRHGFFEFPK